MKRIKPFSGTALFVRAFMLTIILITGGGNFAWGAIVDNGNGTNTENFSEASRTYSNGWVITLPTGWNYSGSTSTLNAYGALYTMSSSNTDSYYISPELSGNFSFIMKSYGTSSASSIKAYECTFENDVLSLGSLIGEVSIAKANPVADYSEKTISFSGNSRIALLMNYAYLDDFTYTPYDGGGSSTPAPTSFSYSSVTYNSASLSWTVGGEETNWQVKYNNGADFDPDEEGAMAGDDPVTTNPYTLSGLSESTTYYAYVRAYIDEENQSDWTGPISFTTPEQYPTPVDLTLDSFTGTTATLSWTNGTGTAATAWQIRYSTSSGFDPDDAETLVDGITTNPYTITDLTAGTTYYARIRADYGSSHYSDWNATELSFTPIDAWETFFSGIPDTWYNSGFVTNRAGYEGQAYSSNSSNVLRTPRLYASKDDELNFYVTLGGGSMTARYYKNNRGSYNTISSYSTSGQKTFVAPSDGYYWIEFTSAYNGAVDNFSGFSIADNENLMELGTKTMSSSGTVGGDYTASVVLRELGGNEETYTAQLYYDGEVVAEKEGETINGNRNETVSLTFTPSEVKSSKPMFIKITYNNGESELTTTSTNVTMSTTSYVFDETGTISRPDANLYSQVVHLKYTAQHGWNTICVPFLLNDTYLEQIFGSDYTVYKINSFSDGALDFKKTTTYAVSTPYLVYTENESEVAENIYLKGVTFYTSNLTSGNKTQTKGDASFIGTFDPIAAPEMNGKYGITTACKLGKGNSSASINGYRAYIEVSDPSLSRLSIVINDEGETTDMGFVRLVDKDAKDVYNLQGQKVKKSGRGIYVVNGRKVVIK